MKLQKIAYGWLTAAAVFVLSILIPVTAFAYDENDTDKSIKLTIVDREGNEPVSNVKFQLYRVAALSEDNSFEMEADFQESGVSLSQDATEESWFDRAVTLEAYVVQRAADNRAISPVGVVTTDMNGSGTFYDLHTGLFLLVGEQTTIDQTICTPLATLISLPYLNEDETWSYEPKVDIKNSFQSISDTYMELSVVKVWKDTGYENHRPAAVKVTLYGNGSEYATVELDKTNNWKYTWENLASDIRWHLVEKSVSPNYTVTAVRDGKYFTVTNTYCSTSANVPQTSTTLTLPQTGQLWWPVSFLSVGGLILLMIGLKIRRKGSNGYETK